MDDALKRVHALGKGLLELREMREDQTARTSRPSAEEEKEVGVAKATPAVRVLEAGVKKAKVWSTRRVCGGCLYPAPLAQWFLPIWGGGWWRPLPAANLAVWGWPLRWVRPAGSSRPTLLEDGVEDPRYGTGDLAHPTF